MKGLIALALLVASVGCGRRHAAERAPYRPIAEVEEAYGPLITAGNHPTPDQHGTGESIGLFRDSSGAVWGMPLQFDGTAVLACAPPAMRAAGITDDFDARSTIIGTVNESTGWRGGTGDLTLLLRDQGGRIYRQTIHGGDLPDGPACGGEEKLHYYLLKPVPHVGR